MKQLTHFFCTFLIAASYILPLSAQEKKILPPDAPAFLGFDANDYPGEAALPALKKTFAFTGYWLNPPPGEEPGESTNSWTGKREILLQNGFGFSFSSTAAGSAS